MTWETYWIIFGVLVVLLIISQARNASVHRHNARMAKLREELAEIARIKPEENPWANSPRYNNRKR